MSKRSNPAGSFWLDPLWRVQSITRTGFPLGEHVLVYSQMIDGYYETVGQTRIVGWPALSFSDQSNLERMAPRTPDGHGRTDACGRSGDESWHSKLTIYAWRKRYGQLEAS
jgi:hypothetical protein